MTTAKHFALTLAITLCALSATAQAQTPRLSTVNVTSDGERVKIAAQGDVSEMRVDIADEQGDVVFESGQLTGQTLDWNMKDAQGERVQPGTYLVTVTFRNAAGKLRKRVEQVTITEDEEAGAKQAPAPSAPQATINGGGTGGRIAKFFDADTIVSSVITESGGKIGIGNTAPTSALTVISTDANNPTITGRNNAAAGIGVFGLAPNGFGVVGQSTSRRGVLGTSSNGEGVFGTSGSGVGVSGESNSGTGVEGFSSSSFGVFGLSNTNIGVRGFSTKGIGVHGQSNSSVGVAGRSFSNSGIEGVSTQATGVAGTGGINGVSGRSTNGVGVRGFSHSGTGVFGQSDSSGTGVFGDSSSGVGVKGTSDKNDGVFGRSSENAHSGVVGSHTGSGIGVYGESLGGGFAGFFAGKVKITGTLTKGGGSFQIDHPLDPANKYLSHSFVESPDMMNIYNGNIVLDRKGQATVQMPAYFSALNRDFRYQLTAIGQPGPRLYIAEEMTGNRFKIAGGRAGMKVSWMVTGIRHDAFADAHRILVEEEKPEKERGTYLHPEVFGQPVEKGVEQARQADQTGHTTADAPRVQTTLQK